MLRLNRLVTSRNPLSRGVFKNKILRAAVFSKPFSTSSCHYNVIQPGSAQCVRSDVEEGKEVEGFVVQQISDVPEFHLRAVRLRHRSTGAQFLHIHRDDDNNAFSAGFRTTPNDSTGLPHILEHTTLCGSELYPCRDPFFKMLNRSMATFMNAMTGPDYTMYPFSTQNQQDYKNLMSVYLDAVFRPQLRELDFRQEGWRLEHEDVKDPNSPVIFKGVVFNEMKGVFAENQSLFGQKLLNYILPSHTYGCISGGDPLVIPQLTYEDLKAFHEKYYHPANARFYSYGNFSLVDHLKYINDYYLSQCKEVSPDLGKKSAVPSEKRWSQERRKHIDCRFDPLAADPQRQSTIAISYLLSDITLIKETFELQVLTELLVKGPNSAFYKSLVEPNIGAGFAPVTGYDAHTRDTVFSVGLQGVNSDDFDKVIDIFDKTVDEVIEKGFDKTHVEGVLHRIELNTKHQSSDFGLGLLFGLTPLWNHDGDVLQALKVSEQVSHLRHEVKNNPLYLQDKVKYYLKENKHRLVLTMSPNEEYEARLTAEENKLLKAKLSSLSEEEKHQIYEQGIKLVNEQMKGEDTSCLPTLTMADIKKTVEITPLTTVHYHSVPLQICIQPTNCVTYFRGILNVGALSDDLKSLLSLFGHVATKMGTSKHNYREFDQLVRLKTGGISISTHFAEDLTRLGAYEEGIMLSSYCLDKNVKDMFYLLSEIFNEVSLKDIKRFETLVKVCAAELANGIVDMGHYYAMSSAGSLISPSAYRKELVSGLSYVTKMREIAQMEDLTSIMNNIQQIAQKSLSKTHARLALNISPDIKDDILQDTETFCSSLGGKVKSPYLKTEVSDFSGRAQAIHYVQPIPVNFAAKSVLTVPYTHADYAPLRVLAKLLTSKYLHPEVREKGGAYGSGANISTSGLLNFFSYRDPNSALTLDIFDRSNSWVHQNSFTNQDIEEAKLGVFQAVDSPVPPGSKGMSTFLYGIDDGTIQRHRNALMAVTRENLIEVSEKYLAPESKTLYAQALIGPENNLLANRDVKWKIITQDP